MGKGYFFCLREKMCAGNGVAFGFLRKFCKAAADDLIGFVRVVIGGGVDDAYGLRLPTMPM